MQIMGDPSQCWFLAAAASRTAVSLGYHNIRDTSISSEFDEEIHVALAWCCHLDKSISLLHMRPPSLPKLHITASELIKDDLSNAMSGFVKTMMDMAEINEGILEVAYEICPMNKQPPELSAVQDQVYSLRSRMAEVHLKMLEVRSSLGLVKGTAH